MSKIRVSAVQSHLHTIESFEQFALQPEHYIKMAEEFAAEFVLFPEFFTTQLMSIGGGAGNALTINALPGFTDRYRELFSSLAKRTAESRNVNAICCMFAEIYDPYQANDHDFGGVKPMGPICGA